MLLLGFTSCCLARSGRVSVRAPDVWPAEWVWHVGQRIQQLAWSSVETQRLAGEE